MTDDATSDYDRTAAQLFDGADDVARRWLLRTGALASGGALFGSATAAGRETETATGDGTETTGDGGDGESTLNEADVAFLQQMVHHHWGALAMAQMVPEYSNRQPLVALAEQMRKTQRDQIQYIQRILRESNVEYRTDDVAPDSNIPGMPSNDGTATLRTIEGEEFDQTFINLMTAHHRGAVILANRVLWEGRSEQVAQLANEIIRAQKRQIYRMYEFYVEWYEPPGTDG